MTGLERMMIALKRGQPDRVPIWELIINDPVINGLHGNISYEDFVEKEDLDGLTIFEDPRVVERFDDRTCKDEWGIIWKIGDHRIPYPIGGPIKDEKDLDTYTHPDPDAEWRFKSLEKAVRRFKGEKAIAFLSHEAFEFSHYLLGGMDRVLLGYVLEPEFMKRLSEMVWSYKSRVLKNAAEAGADILLTGDDYAGRIGPFMSPDHFREFILPYLTKAVGIAKEHNLPFIKHADGNLWKIMDMMVGSGIDALHSIEPIAGMDIGEVKKKYGDRIALVGNVDCTEILPNGSECEVVNAVKETIAKAAVGGGYILSSSNSIHPAVKPENYRTMVKAAREYGVYPLDYGMVEVYRGMNYIARMT